MKTKKEKIGLVLNGGVARSFFQLGVIQSLSNYVNFDIIIGSGWGSLFGATLAVGLPLNKNVKIDDFLIPERDDNWSFFSNEKIIATFLGKKTIEFKDLGKRLILVATDLENNEEIIIRSGKIHPAVEASISFPCFNRVVLHEERFLTDGTITNPFPSDIAWKYGADKIIAIDTISQHFREFDENNVPLTPYIKNAAIAFPPMWLMNKKKIPWMEMRIFETCLTDAIDDYSISRKPFLIIKLEEEAEELARETYFDSFEKIPLLIEAGVKSGEKYGKLFFSS